MKLLKLGGSVLTNKRGWREKADLKAIEALCSAVASAWRKSNHDWVAVHGAGSFGHPLVVKYGINDGVRNAAQKLGFAITHEACSELSVFVTGALNTSGVPAISIPPAAVITSKGRRIHSFNTKIIDDYLESGYLPVLFGDMVPDIELGGSVCSGDQIISYLGKGAERILLATNVDGVLDEKGNVIESITSANFADVSRHFRAAEGKDVTGAMAGKIRELLELDTPSYVVNGLHPERVEALMLGKKAVCTEIKK
jgi:isopentenyl phosphate kinase